MRGSFFHNVVPLRALLYTEGMGYNSRDIDVGGLLTLLPRDKEKGGVIITLIGMKENY